MSKRLQVILGDDEMSDLRDLAAREGVTVSEWVRLSLRDARRRRASGDVEDRLARVRAAVTHAFPAPDVDQMLAEGRSSAVTRLVQHTRRDLPRLQRADVPRGRTASAQGGGPAAAGDRDLARRATRH